MGNPGFQTTRQAILPRRLLRTAISQLQQYQAAHRQSFGALLGQAVQKGLDSIIKIGGFVLLFSWADNNSTPNCGWCSIDSGTEMSRNNGLELLVKAAKRAASCGVQRDCSFREAVRMAPMGFSYCLFCWPRWLCYAIPRRLMMARAVVWKPGLPTFCPRC